MDDVISEDKIFNIKLVDQSYLRGFGNNEDMSFNII